MIGINFEAKAIRYIGYMVYVLYSIILKLVFSGKLFLAFIFLTSFAQNKQYNESG